MPSRSIALHDLLPYFQEHFKRIVLWPELPFHASVGILHPPVRRGFCWQPPGINGDGGADNSEAPYNIITGEDGYSTFLPRNNTIDGTGFQLVRDVSLG